MARYTGSTWVSGKGSGKMMQLAAQVSDNTGQLERKLRQVVQELKREYAELVGELARDYIIEYGAVDTGAMYRSVQVDRVRFIAHCGQGLTPNYAVYVNEGTYRMVARPFWTRAVRDARKKLGGGYRVKMRIHTGRAF